MTTLRERGWEYARTVSASQRRDRLNRKRLRQWRLWRRFFPSGRAVFADVRTWTTIDVPVVDGVATLPDGRTVASKAQVVRVPVLA